jgi:hypothetical protein
MVCKKYSTLEELETVKCLILECLDLEKKNVDLNEKCVDSLIYFEEMNNSEKNKIEYLKQFKIIRNFLLNTTVSLPTFKDPINDIYSLPNRNESNAIETYSGHYIGFHLRSTTNNNPATFETVLLTIFSDGLARIDRSSSDSVTNAGYYKASKSGQTIIGEFDYFIDERYNRFKHVLNVLEMGSGKRDLVGISLGKSIDNFPSSNRIYFIKVERIVDIIRKLKYLYLLHEDDEQIEKMYKVYNIYNEFKIQDVNLSEIKKLLLEFPFIDFEKNLIKSYSDTNFFKGVLENNRHKIMFDSIRDKSGKIFDKDDIKAFKESEMMKIVNFFTDENFTFTRYSDGPQWAKFSERLKNNK